MKTFVLGDVHGAHKAFLQVMERSGFDYENDLLITLGDIVDGWPDVYNLVEELLKIKNRIDIRGNHDDWFVDFIQNGLHPDYWRQGGLGTAQSYAEGVGLEFKYQKNISGNIVNLNPGDIPESHIKFFKGQVNYYKDEWNNLFIHGGFDKNVPLRGQMIDLFYWDRRLWNQALSAKSGNQRLNFAEDFNEIYIGHTSVTIWGKDTPMSADLVWNMDTGAGWEGKLSLMNITTKEVFQSDPVCELYEKSTR